MAEKKTSSSQSSLLPRLAMRSRLPYAPHYSFGPMKDQSAPSLLLQLPEELLLQIAWNLEVESAQNLALTCRALTEAATARLWRWLHVSAERDIPLGMDVPHPFSAEVAVRMIARHRQALQSRLEAVVARGEDWWPKVEHFCTILRTGSDAAVGEILSRTAPTLRSFKICASFDEDYPTSSNFDPEGRLLRRDERIFKSNATLSFPSLTHIDLGTDTVHSQTVILLCQSAPNLVSLECWITEYLRPAIIPPSGAPVPTPRRLTQNTKLRRISVEYSAGFSMGAGRYHAIEVLLNILGFSPGLEQVCLSIDAEMLDLRIGERISALENLKDLCWREELDIGFRRRRVDSLGSSATVRRLILGYGMSKWQLPNTEVGDTVSLPLLEVAFIQTDRYGAISSQRTAFPPTAPVQPLKPSFARWLETRPLLHSIYIFPDIRRRERFEVFSKVDTLEATQKPNAKIMSVRHGQEELLVVRLLLCETTVAKKRDGQRVSIKRRVISGLDRWRRVGGVPEVEESWQVFSYYKGAMVPSEVMARMKAAEASGESWDTRGLELGEVAWNILREWRASLPAEAEIAEEEDLAPSEDDYLSHDEADTEL